MFDSTTVSYQIQHLNHFVKTFYAQKPVQKG